MKQTDILIIGAGPAGMAAAIEAARAGATITVLDENTKSGGQIFRQFHDSFQVLQAKNLGPDYARGQSLINKFNVHSNSITCMYDAQVWGIFEDREVACFQGQESFSIRFKKLIITAGAYDRPVPFPGWTLPGVFTAGGAQRLVKNLRVLPGKKILLAGTGPLQLALASQISKARGQVAAIAEAGNVENWAKLIRAMVGQWELIGDACRYLFNVQKSRIPILRRHIILEARGDGRVEEAILAEVDRQWRPKPGTEKTFKVDTICSGYGFIPSAEMTLLAGCAHTYDPQLGGWIPVRTPEMRTSRIDIYAAGDCTGVAGSKVAMAEGRIAGAFAAAALGCFSDTEAERRTRECRQNLVSLNRLRAVLDGISAPKPGLYELADAQTILCRCMEITLQDLKAFMREYSGDINEVKRMTSIGMGPCQGRICGQVIQEIVAREKGLPSDAIRFLSPRPPIKNIPLAALANHS